MYRAEAQQWNQKAMSIECKTKLSKNDASINAIHIHIYIFFIQITDKKKNNGYGILECVSKQRWEEQTDYKYKWTACSELGPGTLQTNGLM